jgi:hypothetical protein
MSTGRHAADFTIVRFIDRQAGFPFVGLARPDIDVRTPNANRRDNFCRLRLGDGARGDGGRLYHAGEAKPGSGQAGGNQGDVVGLLLDCDAGTLAVKKNGKFLGVAATGLAGALCWAVSMYADATLRIAAADGW